MTCPGQSQPGRVLTASANSSLYDFRVRTDVKEFAVYVEDTITKGAWNFNIGLRGDIYNGFASAGQAEPRLGAAYKVKKTNTVLRLSYAHTMESPFNENLILSSNGCDVPALAADLFAGHDKHRTAPERR